ncbi:hypothetical protein NIES1031_18890 [Chroogloeocystis siderophila 5.2 s.c.1]|uniref:Uncharacterized protein n=2 Tax=Chroogloeocystis TaxID=329162 RepID=A0A1U7HHZ3_9CHRO|nr:hypothetical protein NIES1031_18890 [Chroogloeocystis siderophila 5.2 s.c.1]
MLSSLILRKVYAFETHFVQIGSCEMTVITATHTFTSNNFETIETAFNIPRRRICVFPTVPLRLRTAFFTTANSNNGCINYGGTASIAVQRVQAKGFPGQTIQIEQSLPIGE